MSRAIVVLTCLHLLVPTAGQGLKPSSPTVGATEISSQLQQQYKSSLAWRRSYKLKPQAACRSTNSASLCGADSTKDLDAHARLVDTASPPAYSSRDVKWTDGSGPLHRCSGGWDLRSALTELQNRGQSLPTAGCLPYKPDVTEQYSYDALCSGSCAGTSKYASQGQFFTVEMTMDWEVQQHIRQYGSVVTRFDVYDDFQSFFKDSHNAQAVYRPKHGAQFNFTHAIVLVGYDNAKEYWIAKNSWGSKWADAGYFKVAYGVCSVLTPNSGEAFGVIWTTGGDDVLSAPQSQSLQRMLEAGSKGGCYFYEARPGDYMSKVAWLANIPLQQFMADNTPYVKDLDSLEGTKLLLCNPKLGTNTKGAIDEKSRQLEALLTIKPYIDKGNVLQGWSHASGEDGGYCSWQGVTCNDNAVVKLDLSHGTVQGLHGTLPPAAAFAGLEGLTWLALYDQPGIEGPLPDWSSLGQIVSIDLWGNGLIGTLPPSLSKVTKLKVLHLTSNKLTGTIPDSWQALKNMEDLQIGDNLLTGSIPTWLGSFSNLRVLGLSRCKLSGSLPSSLARVAFLQTLWLYNNPQLGGCIPSSLKGQLAGSNFYNNVLAGTKITGFCVSP